MSTTSMCPAQLHGVVLRSPHGHAADRWHRYRRSARDARGAAASSPPPISTPTGSGLCRASPRSRPSRRLIVPPRPALARDRVRHVGDPVAFVVADTHRPGARRRRAGRGRLPAAAGGGRCDGGARRRRAAACGTRRRATSAYRFERGDKAAVDAAFAAAAHVVEIELDQQPAGRRPDRAARRDRQLRCRRRSLRPAADRPGRAQPAPAACAMRCSICRPSASRCARPMSGAGLASRISSIPNGCWCCGRRGGWAARSNGSPSAARSSSARRKAATTIRAARLALDRDGRFLALEVDTVANLGAYLSTNGPGSSTNSPASAMGGVYDIPAVFMAVRGVFTNTVPIDAYRGAGKPEANYLIERLVDRAARRLGARPGRVAPAQYDQPFPVSQRARHHDRLRTLRRQSRRDGAAAADRRLCRTAPRRQRRAAGCAGSASPVFSKPRAARRASAPRSASKPTASVALVLGTQSNGQGHETSFAQIAADLLGLPIAAFRFVQADTRDGQERQRAWRRPLDAYGRHRAATRRRRWCCRRAARLPPTCCRPMRAR